MWLDIVVYMPLILIPLAVEVQHTSVKRFAIAFGGYQKRSLVKSCRNCSNRNLNKSIFLTALLVHYLSLPKRSTTIFVEIGRSHWVADNY